MSINRILGRGRGVKATKNKLRNKIIGEEGHKALKRTPSQRLKPGENQFWQIRVEIKANYGKKLSTLYQEV